jgi:hypothetical protein
MQSVHLYSFSSEGNVIVCSSSSTTIPLVEPSLMAKLLRLSCFLSSINVTDCGPEMTKKERLLSIK